MIIITGGAGFIGSAILAHLNNCGISDIIIVDEPGCSENWKNLRTKKFSDYINKNDFLKLIESDSEFKNKITAIIHMGASSATTVTDIDFLMKNNYEYTLKLAKFAMQHEVRFIYASSASTYGDGKLGYSDADDKTPNYIPLHPYGFSKQIFDLKALREGWTDKICGLKFFNVYGPNEYHKGDMLSVVHKAYEQFKTSGKVKLFKSYHPSFADGEQKRDFIYVKDCAKITHWLLQNPKVNGIFNVGTGKARSWNDLVAAVASAMQIKNSIEYIDMPKELINQYQYFTEATMHKLIEAGYKESFYSLEEGVRDYIVNYLEKDNKYM